MQRQLKFLSICKQPAVLLRNKTHFQQNKFIPLGCIWAVISVTDLPSSLLCHQTPIFKNISNSISSSIATDRRRNKRIQAVWYAWIQRSLQSVTGLLSMTILLILKNKTLKGFVIPVKHYFRRQPSICSKSHHILVGRPSWQHSFPCLQEEIWLRF